MAIKTIAMFSRASNKQTNKDTNKQKQNKIKQKKQPTTLSVTVKTCFFYHVYFKNLSAKGSFQLWQTLTLHFLQTDVSLCCILGISILAVLLNSVNFF